MSETEVKKPFISGLVEGCLDPVVYQDIMKTHAKECISFLDFGNLAITNVDSKIMNRVQFTECEISPFHHRDVTCQNDQEPFFERAPSFVRFNSKPANFSAIQQLLIESFSPDKEAHRPYPSAGGLYPVETVVFLFPERIQSETLIQSGAYHFRALSKKLQWLKALSLDVFCEKLLHNLLPQGSSPCFALLYIAHTGKTLFKYRYRGYRHALMEAGSMYQQALTTSQIMGFRSSLWSSFSDHEMLFALDLDYAAYLPLTLQLFGYGDSE